MGFLHPWASSTKRSILALSALCASLFSFTPGIAREHGVEVDAEIVLAVDISYSMDRTEQELQREGYVKALTSEAFLNALKSNGLGKIALTYIQWASFSDQDVVLNWTVIDGPASAQAVADKLARAPYRRAQRTSISGAIDASVRLFNYNGFKGTRQVIDISGDGPNNHGRGVVAARDDAIAKGVTINGLPLLIRPVRTMYMDIENLDQYYEDCVIGGPGAFMIPVRDSAAFVEATRTKLVQEIASRSVLPVIRASAREPRMSCMVGEDLWRRLRGD